MSDELNLGKDLEQSQSLVKMWHNKFYALQSKYDSLKEKADKLRGLLDSMVKNQGTYIHEWEIEINESLQEYDTESKEK